MTKKHLALLTSSCQVQVGKGFLRALHTNPQGRRITQVLLFTA